MIADLFRLPAGKQKNPPQRHVRLRGESRSRGTTRIRRIVAKPASSSTPPRAEHADGYTLAL